MALNFITYLPFALLLLITHNIFAEQAPLAPLKEYCSKPQPQHVKIWHALSGDASIPKGIFPGMEKLAHLRNGAFMLEPGHIIVMRCVRECQNMELGNNKNSNCVFSNKTVQMNFNATEDGKTRNFHLDVVEDTKCECDDNAQEITGSDEIVQMNITANEDGKTQNPQLDVVEDTKCECDDNVHEITGSNKIVQMDITAKENGTTEFPMLEVVEDTKCECDDTAHEITESNEIVQMNCTVTEDETTQYFQPDIVEDTKCKCDDNAHEMTESKEVSSANTKDLVMYIVISALVVLVIVLVIFIFRRKYCRKGKEANSC